MPQAIAAAATAVGTYVGQAALTAGIATTATQGFVIASVTTAVMEVGIYTGLALATSADIPPKLPA